MLTPSSHSTALEFSQAERAWEAPSRSSATLPGSCDSAAAHCSQPVTLGVSRTHRLQVEAGEAWGRMGSFYQEKLVKYVCGSSNCPAIPPC